MKKNIIKLLSYTSLLLSSGCYSGGGGAGNDATGQKATSVGTSTTSKHGSLVVDSSDNGSYSSFTVSRERFDSMHNGYYSVLVSGKDQLYYNSYDSERHKFSNAWTPLSLHGENRINFVKFCPHSDIDRDQLLGVVVGDAGKIHFVTANQKKFSVVKTIDTNSTYDWTSVSCVEYRDPDGEKDSNGILSRMYVAVGGYKLEDDPNGDPVQKPIFAEYSVNFTNQSSINVVVVSPPIELNNLPTLTEKEKTDSLNYSDFFRVDFMKIGDIIKNGRDQDETGLMFSTKYGIDFKSGETPEELVKTKFKNINSALKIQFNTDNNETLLYALPTQDLRYRDNDEVTDKIPLHLLTFENMGINVEKFSTYAETYKFMANQFHPLIHYTSIDNPPVPKNIIDGVSTPLIKEMSSAVCSSVSLICADVYRSTDRYDPENQSVIQFFYMTNLGMRKDMTPIIISEKDEGTHNKNGHLIAVDEVPPQPETTRNRMKPTVEFLVMDSNGNFLSYTFSDDSNISSLKQFTAVPSLPLQNK